MSLIQVLSILCLVLTIVTASDCQPSTWGNVDGDLGTTSISSVVPSASANLTTISAGTAICRSWRFAPAVINCCTCSALASRYDISIDFFFKMNPEIKRDCSNLAPKSKYCIDGFIQPIRSDQGWCGPLHGNASCYGLENPCCNSKTWKCGVSFDDCQDGTCYEGNCPGHKVFTTDGKCGTQNGGRRCAGVWGDCCNMSGVCGTGPDYCGDKNCQSGNCTVPASLATVSGSGSTPSPPWLVGNTTDGSCGPNNSGYTCDVVYGNCCNSNGQCGVLPADCDLKQGCQAKYGLCSGTTSSTMLTTTKTSVE